jgi:UrcA family protein
VIEAAYSERVAGDVGQTISASATITKISTSVVRVTRLRVFVLRGRTETTGHRREGFRLGFVFAPGEQRRVVHREFRGIRRISRERPKDPAQNFSHRRQNPVQLKEIVMQNQIKTKSAASKFVMIAGLFALSCGAIGGTALAQTPTAATHELVSYPVQYSDLDVSKVSGAKTLYLRIRYAAESLCESTATWGKKEGQACVQKAVNDAVVRVDAPLLTQYSQLRSKGDKAGLVQLAKSN